MPTMREISLEFQNYIEKAPVPAQNMYKMAASNDDVTMDKWLDTWMGNIKANKAHVGSFKEKGLGNLFGQYLHRPVIVAGSGPSLKFNVKQLADRKGIPLISCLHNFHYFEDNGVAPEYYTTIDAGTAPIEEVTEGGTKSEEEYWEMTKDRTLLAFIGTHPTLLKRWKGQIYYFNCPIPNEQYMERVDEEVERFRTLVSTGGNVFGASVYIAKAIFGAGALVTVGADFSFGYDNKFHSYDSKYDTRASESRYTQLFDIFGNKVKTWPSYANFKFWFDWLASVVPGIYINCTEGGCFGSYPEGNIMQVKQMALSECIDMYSMSAKIKEQCINPEVEGDLGKMVLF